MQDFRHLAVWESAQQLTVSVYRVTERLSSTRTPGLRSQLRRAAASIGANIAEGSAADSPAQFARYLLMAMGSCSEVESHLDLAARLGAIRRQEVATLSEACRTLRRRLTALRRRVLESNRRPDARTAAGEASPATVPRPDD